MCRPICELKTVCYEDGVSQEKNCDGGKCGMLYGGYSSVDLCKQNVCVPESLELEHIDPEDCATTCEYCFADGSFV